MDQVLSICLGLALAAACGFRVFVPLLCMSVAQRTGHLALQTGFEWIGSDAALLVFSVATALELGAYFVPWLDNLLDSMATPTAVVAGIVVTAASVQGMSPLLAWTLAALAGGGLAGAVSVTTAVARGASSLTTGGLGNPVLAAGEAAGAVTLSALAVLLPVLAALVVLSLLAGAVLLARRRWPRTARQA